MKTPKQAVEQVLRLAKKVAVQAYIDSFDAKQAKRAVRLTNAINELGSYGYKIGRPS